MNLTRRIVSWWKMFAHLMVCMDEGEYHVEELHVEGPEIFGVHFGVVFVSRHCYTCGYLQAYKGLE